MGPAPKDCAFRACERKLGAASARKLDYIGLQPGIPGQRTRLSSRDRGGRPAWSTDQSANDRALSVGVPGFRVDVFQSALGS